jgi:hypothetical protein
MEFRDGMTTKDPVCGIGEVEGDTRTSFFVGLNGGWALRQLC